MVGLCDTGAEALKILKTHYENKSEAYLGIALTRVKEQSQLPYPPDIIVGEPDKQKDDLDNLRKTFKEDLQGGIEAHIEAFERRWEKMLETKKRDTPRKGSEQESQSGNI